MRPHWRRVFWMYRAADDGVCIFIFGRGFHLRRISDNDRRVLLETD